MEPKRADYVIGKKNGKVFEVKPKPFTGPKVNPFRVADAPSNQTSNASHPSMNFDGGLDSYGLPPKLA